jgi:hypothetical protein
MKPRLMMLVLSASLILTIVPVAAQSFVVDFEDFDLGGAQYLNTPQTLTFSNVDGSGVTVTIEGGMSQVRIMDLFLFAEDPNTAGQALIDWDCCTAPYPTNPFGTTIRFDPPVASFSLRAGDFGGDDDSPLRIVAYDTSSNVIGEDSRAWDETQFPPFATLSVAGPGIARVHYLSGGNWMNSTFIDDLSFSIGPIPVQPTTWGRVKSLYR